MSIRKRYLLTAVGIIFALVSLVTAVRLTHRGAAASNFENVKIKGPQGAPIQMVVYSDFQCPACFSAVEPVEALRKEFAGVMQVEFRHFPLERTHAWALVAAGFAECAAKQGKFWEFHDRLFQ